MYVIWRHLSPLVFLIWESLIISPLPYSINKNIFHEWEDCKLNFQKGEVLATSPILNEFCRDISDKNGNYNNPRKTVFDRRNIIPYYRVDEI